MKKKLRQSHTKSTKMLKEEKLMTAIVFDTLAYAKKLKKAGFTEIQAELQAEALADLANEKLATKHDLRALEHRLTDRLTIRLGGMLAVSIGIFATLIKLL